MFKKAVRSESKLRLAIAGPSGSGKTYTALAIATNLTDKPVALVDTENGSASKYADDPFTFDVAEMHEPFHPKKFITAIQEAANAGYGVIILDSLSHAWMGPGGLLDIVDEKAKSSRSGNSFTAWKEGTPIQNDLIHAIVNSPIHIIATMRSKTDYVMKVGDNGKQTPEKVGLAAIQRDGMEYEFDVFLQMTKDNDAIVEKSRCSALAGRVIAKPGKNIADTLKAWLAGSTGQPTPAQRQPDPIVPPSSNGTNGDSKAEKSNAHKSFMAEGTNLFGKEWTDARHWLIERYTKKATPDNVRTSANALTDSELNTLRAALVAHPDTYKNDWQKQQQPVAA